MSEQTANLCTTDACESLRARLANYEDAEGRPVGLTHDQAELIGLVRDLALRSGKHARPLIHAAALGLESQAREIERLTHHIDQQDDAYALLSLDAGRKMDELEQQIAALKAQPIAVVPARPTGLSQGWNLVRQCDGFVIGHSAEEPEEQHKANALNDGRVYVPFLVPASAVVVDDRAAFEAAIEASSGMRPGNYSPDYDRYVSERLQGQYEGWKLARALTASAPNHSEQVRQMVLEELLTRCAEWCDKQPKQPWYGRTAGDMVRTFMACQPLAAAPSAGSQKEQG